MIVGRSMLSFLQKSLPNVLGIVLESWCEKYHLDVIEGEERV